MDHDDERMEEARRRVSEQTPEAMQFALDVIHDMALQVALIQAAWTLIESEE